MNAMSDLSIRSASEGAVSAPRRALTNVGSGSPDVSANASSQRSVSDVSNHVSPKGLVDPQSGVYVLQFRDGETGEVLNQYPSEKVVDAYKRGASNGGGQSAPKEGVASVSSSSSGAVVAGSIGTASSSSVSTTSEVSAPASPRSSGT